MRYATPILLYADIDGIAHGSRQMLSYETFSRLHRSINGNDTVALLLLKEELAPLRVGEGTNGETVAHICAEVRSAAREIILNRRNLLTLETDDHISVRDVIIVCRGLDFIRQTETERVKMLIRSSSFNRANQSNVSFDTYMHQIVLFAS